jgi:hypothetical protein
VNNRLTKAILAVAVFGLAVTVLRADNLGGLLSAAGAAAGVMMLAFMTFVMLAAGGGWRPRT